MTNTYKKHWVNGYRVSGGWFNTISLSLFNYAVMFSWGKVPDGRIAKFKTQFYKLIK